LSTKTLESRVMTCATCGVKFRAAEAECSSNQWRSRSGKDCSICDEAEDEEIEDDEPVAVAPAQPYIIPVEKKVKLKEKQTELVEVAEVKPEPPKRLTAKELKEIGRTIAVPVRVFASNGKRGYEKKDCSAWLRRRTDRDIERLANDDWRGSGNCDDYEYWMVNNVKDPEAIEFDDYMDTVSCGWVVEFDIKAVIEWVRYNRPR
jgi:hypothetical protein